MFNRLADDVFVVQRDEFSLHRITVLRRRGHDAQVTRTQQRELQRTRNRRRRQGQYVNVRPQRFQFLLYRHAEFLFLIDDKQSQVVPFDGLTHYFMRADEDIYFACCQVGEQFLGLFGRFESAEELNPHRHVRHALAESVVVLQCQHSGRYQYRHLFAVSRDLKRGTHGYFRLTETYVTADESVHRHRTLQVVFHIRRRLRLVWRILIEERCLQFMLHVSVGRIGETLLLLAHRIQTYQVARYLFHLVLRPLFQPFPLSASQTRYRRFASFTSFVLADAVKIVNRDKNTSAIAIVQTNHLLRATVDRRHDQTAETCNTVVGMYHVVTYTQLVNLTQGDDGFAATGILRGHRHAVIALEYLMVGVAANLQPVVYKSLMQRRIDTNKSNRQSRSYSGAVFQC